MAPEDLTKHTLILIVFAKALSVGISLDKAEVDIDWDKQTKLPPLQSRENSFNLQKNLLKEHPLYIEYGFDTSLDNATNNANAFKVYHWNKM